MNGELGVHPRLLFRVFGSGLGVLEFDKPPVDIALLKFGHIGGFVSKGVQNPLEY